MWARATDLGRAAALATLAAAAASAHPGAPALWRIRPGTTEIESRILLSVRDVAGTAPAAVAERVVPHFVIRSRGRALPARIAAARLRSADELEVELRHALDQPADALEIESTFFELTDAGHVTVVRIEREGRTEAFVLGIERPARRIQLAEGIGSQRLPLVVALLLAAPIAALALWRGRLARLLRGGFARLYGR